LSRWSETLSALIFDFDGTLAAGDYDFPAMRRRVLALAAQYAVNAQALDGLYVLEAVDRAAEIIGANTAQARQFRDDAGRIILDIELAGARTTRLLPGAAAAMALLRDHGYRLAVVTRNSREVIATIPGANALPCDAFLAREAVRRVKPHPDHLLAALAALGCEAREAAMVGDHPMDMATGLAVGATVVGVLTGAGTRETLTAAGAHLIVGSVTDLARMLIAQRGGAPLARRQCAR
jgi:phosphoglycolate phosphatase